MTEQEFFTYKGLPLVRKDNTIYYGNMSDKYVAMLTVLSTHKDKGTAYVNRSENPGYRDNRKDERKRQSL